MYKQFYSSLRQPLVFIAMVFAMFALLQSSQAQPNQLLDPLTQVKFTDPLPRPAVLDFSNGGFTTLRIGQTMQWLGLRKPNGAPLITKVWGYGQGNSVTYPGPTIRGFANVPIQVKWENNLPDGHLLPVDHTLHMAHPAKGVATVTHLHGGHTESASDGLPEAWFTRKFKEMGPQWVKQTYLYDNSQEAATLWYHDHALGLTRLNVYAGLAGFYLLSDNNEKQLKDSNVLPAGDYEREIVIQDRMFDKNGKLYYPSTAAEFYPPGEIPPLAPNPTVLPEFFGNFIVVNGMTWPKLEVEPRKYRLRLLNGSDSRFYILKMSNGQSLLQIGTDNGLLPFPVSVPQLLLAPGERADVVVDFTGQAGAEIIFENLGPDEPFQGLDAGQLPADPLTTGVIMKFVVNQPLSGVPNASVNGGTSLRPAIQPLVQDGATRQLALFEGTDNLGRLQPLLGTLAEGSLAWFEPITETPMLDDVEVWEVYNATMDAHPVHLHMVSFQILDRRDFNGTVTPKPQPQHDGTFGEGGILQVNALTGPAQPPAANERGWKDTFVANPGTVTRVIAKFDRVGQYVWHCHILSHEDHEMMRPFEVLPGPAPLAAPVVKGFDLKQNVPNPFSYYTDITFKVTKDEPVSLSVYDMQGRLVVKLLDEETFTPGWHTATWYGVDPSGNESPDGMYFYELTSGSLHRTMRMVLHRL